MPMVNVWSLVKALFWRWWVALCLLVVLVLAVSGAWWALHQAGPSAQVLSWLPGVKVIDPKGGLLGEFSARRLEIQLTKQSVLTLLEPRWHGLTIRRDSTVAWSIGLDVASLEARRADLQWVSEAAPDQPVALRAPDKLDLPLSVSIGVLKLGALHSNLWSPNALENVNLALSLQGRCAAALCHRVQIHQLDVNGWTLHGLATVKTRQDLLVALTLEAKRLANSAGPSVGKAALNLQGPLAHLLVNGQVDVGEDASAQSLLVSGEVDPFQPWPVSRLAVQSRQFDLAVLWPSFPKTALSGRLFAQPTAASAQRKAPDLTLELALDNALAGPWDAARLPIQRLAGRVELPVAQSGALAGQLASLGQTGQVALTLILPRDSVGGSGTVLLSGGWDLLTPQQTLLRADIQGLEPQALDTRAPALQLKGQVIVRSAPEPAKASESAPAAPGLQWERWAVSTELSGQGRPQPGGPARALALTLSGHWSPDLLDISALNLRSGRAQAKLTGRLDLPKDAAWRALGQLALVDFDPQLWMPWPAMAKGVHRLQGGMSFDLDAKGQGEVTAHLDHSQLAGVALGGSWLVQAPVGRPEVVAKVDLSVGGNQMSLQARLPVIRPIGGGVRWAPDRPLHAQLDAQAKALQTLQPFAQWWGWQGLQGQAVGQVAVDGIWPAVETQGTLDVTGLQIKSPSDTLYGAAQVNGRWRFNIGSLSAPVQAQWSVKDARVGSTQVDQWALSLAGSAQSHQLTAQGELRVPVKAGGTSAQRVHLDLALQGHWLEAARGWEGQLQRWSAVTVEPSPRTLLSIDQPLDLAWARSDTSDLLGVSPGRVSVLGVAVKIENLQWQMPRNTDGSGAQVEVSMAVEPLKLAEVLARLQPQAGWGGDLVVAGQLHVHHQAHQPWQVDAFMARRDGDLTLSEPATVGGGVQALGIRQARLELKAQDGVWSLVEQFEGRVLGKVSGRQTVQAQSPERLPSSADRLVGSLDVKIDNLRPWGVWVPAGWRLSGQLEAKAAIAGTLGAPQYQGQVSGRNLGAVQALLGVNLTDGQLQLALQGDQARLTSFTAKGGERGGTLSLQGDAVFGAEPQARLQLVADHFALLQRVDRRAVVSGQAQLVLGADDLKAEGHLSIDEGLIDISRADAPTIGDDVNVINRPGEPPPEDEAGASGNGVGPKRKLQVAIELDLGRQLRLKGRGLDAQLVGKLRLTTPNGRPAMHGVIKTASGSYVAYAQKLVLERGSLAFTGPIDNPRLDILAMRSQSPLASSDDVKVGVTITGTAQDPRVRLYSDPSMSETEKLSWLVLGRGAAGLGGADIGLLQTAASALLAGEGGSPKDSVLSAIGLDDLSVRQTDGEVKETIVNVGKQISRAWYVGYERSLNATSGNWQVIYRLAQRFTLRAQAGQDSAMDLIWSWKFD